MNIALVAHDGRKKELLEWVRYNAMKLFEHRLFATGTTGKIIQDVFKEEDDTFDDEYEKNRYYDYKITNKKLNELREDFFIEELKSKLEIDSLVWSNEQNTYITNYHIELDDLINNIKKPVEKLQHQVDIINLEYEHKLKKYEKKLSKVNNLKAKIEQEIEIKTEYENSLKQLMPNFQTQEDDLQKNKNNKIVKKAETHRNKKNFKFYFNHIKYFIKNNSNEYDKIVKKINALNKEIDKNNKALIIECQKLDKKQICYEKVLYKRNEVKSQLDSFLRKLELTKRELIKKLFHKLNPSFFD